MVNFGLPYLSRNPSEFWRRWHISLSSWLRDYLYIGLGGNQKGEARTYVNLMATMALGGLWHGTAANYFQGSLLCVHRAATGKRHTLPTGRAAVTNHAPAVMPICGPIRRRLRYSAIPGRPLRLTTAMPAFSASAASGDPN